MNCSGPCWVHDAEYTDGHKPEEYVCTCALTVADNSDDSPSEPTALAKARAALDEALRAEHEAARMLQLTLDEVATAQRAHDDAIDIHRRARELSRTAIKAYEAALLQSE